MNLERLEIIARWLEAGGEENGVPAHFQMDTYVDVSGGDRGCGTAACIMGAAALLWGYSDGNSFHAGRKHLGLTGRIGAALGDPGSFGPNGVTWTGEDPELEVRPSGWPEDNCDIDAAWAARTIRHLMKTGEVAWHLTREPSNA